MLLQGEREEERFCFYKSHTQHTHTQVVQFGVTKTDGGPSATFQGGGGPGAGQGWPRSGKGEDAEGCSPEPELWAATRSPSRGSGDAIRGKSPRFSSSSEKSPSFLAPAGAARHRIRAKSTPKCRGLNMLQD